MNLIEVQECLQNLTNQKITQADLGRALGIDRSSINVRLKRKTEVKLSDLQKLTEYFRVNLSALTDLDLKNETNLSEFNNIAVFVTYRPDVYLSAGYGVEVYDESAQKMVLDAALLITDRGNKINPDNCEIVRVSGNSMSPEYRHGDRVIIDKGDTMLSDGHIFAFRYNGECYVKEINLLGNKIKCISLNKEYDPFYIEKTEDFVVFGKILPRIRL